MNPIWLAIAGTLLFAALAGCTGSGTVSDDDNDNTTATGSVSGDGDGASASGRATPGFEPVLAIGALGAAIGLAAWRRR
jgi:hypothetical protein